MYSEDELVPLSALEHWLFCPRQCALIHIEQLWAENRLTAEGRILHDRVHEKGAELRGDLRTARSVRLRSLRLGICGVADVVEFQRAGPDEPGAALQGVPGRWLPFPVEFKRGVRRSERAFEVQLCAQALCLEEMLGIRVPAGSVFYGKSRRRVDVPFDLGLRGETEATAREVHALVAAGVTPPAVHGEKCSRCSLRPVCLPALSAGRSAAAYVDESLAALKLYAERDQPSDSATETKT